MTETPNDTAPTIQDQLTAVTQQLGILLGVTLQCATCVADARQGATTNVNLANVIVGGTGLCHNHVDIASGRLVPRTSGGIILGNGG